jgi:RNA polymerase sigma factor (TIGR02999 family)
MLQQSGGGSAPADLMAVIYEDLHEIARRAMGQERQSHTLQATALVHEAYVRLVDQTRVDWQGRAHFLAVAAEAMRRILVDHARRRAAAKRGGGQLRVALDDGLRATEAPPDEDLLELDGAMHELAAVSARQARVVELRFFGGMEFLEIAAELGVSERTVKGDWRFARAWLRQRLDR